MILSVSEQMRLFLMAIGAGIGAGLAYDAFRILRMAIPHSSIIVQLEDMVYWVFVMLGMSLFVLYAMEGELRGYVIFGAFLGAVLYFAAASPIVMGLAGVLIGFARYLLGVFVVRPLRFVFRVVVILIGALERAVIRPLKIFLKKVLQIGRIYGRIGGGKLGRDIVVMLRKR